MLTGTLHAVPRNPFVRKHFVNYNYVCDIELFRNKWGRDKEFDAIDYLHGMNGTRRSDNMMTSSLETNFLNSISFVKREGISVSNKTQQPFHEFAKINHIEDEMTS